MRLGGVRLARRSHSRLSSFTASLTASPSTLAYSCVVAGTSDLDSVVGGAAAASVSALIVLLSVKKEENVLVQMIAYSYATGVSECEGGE